eukprot:m.85601 g.85601  ORF g.85601 m.85601 type:complete len:206 (+) comp14727_c0_seq1:1504-2121(+)
MAFRIPRECRRPSGRSKSKSRSRSTTPRNSRSSSPYPPTMRIFVHGLPLPRKLVRESGVFTNMQYCCRSNDDLELQAFVDQQALELLLQVYKRPQDYRLLATEQLFTLLELVNYLDIARIYNYVISELARRCQTNIAGPITQRILAQHRDCLVDMLRKLPEFQANHVLRRRLCSRLEYKMAYPKGPSRRWRSESESSDDGAAGNE